MKSFDLIHENPQDCLKLLRMASPRTGLNASDMSVSVEYIIPGSHCLVVDVAGVPTPEYMLVNYKDKQLNFIISWLPFKTFDVEGEKLRLYLKFLGYTL